MSFENQFENNNENNDQEGVLDVLNEEPLTESFRGLGEINTDDLRKAIEEARR